MTNTGTTKTARARRCYDCGGKFDPCACVTKTWGLSQYDEPAPAGIQVAGVCACCAVDVPTGGRLTRVPTATGCARVCDDCVEPMTRRAARLGL